MPDLSIILNVHRETYLLARTVESLSEAAAFARLNGTDIELVIVLDNSDAGTRLLVDKLDLCSFNSVQRVEVDNRSLSQSRNDGIAVARGRFISTHDADDLISFNFFDECFKKVNLLGEKIILFPEWVVGFGTRNFLSRYRDADLAKLSIIETHPFISCCFFPRESFLSQKYRRLDSSRGEAYEDWLFNAEAISNGFKPSFCQNVILFYRQSRRSMMAMSRASSDAFEIPHCRLFQPSVYREVFGEDLLRLPRMDSIRNDFVNSRRLFLSQRTLKVLTAAANRIDPTVELRNIHQRAELFDPLSSAVSGIAYLEICNILGDATFDDVFIMPSLVAGGGERYLLDVMNGLSALSLTNNVLVICGEQAAAHVWRDRLPSDAKFLDLRNLSVELSDSQIDCLTLRVIQSTASNARIHFKTSLYAHRFFAKYHRHLYSNRCYYYRFCDDVYVDEGSMTTAGWQLEFLSETLCSIERLISDNWATIHGDIRLFGVEPEKWTCLPALVASEEICRHPDRTPTRKLLWASRVASQKRPTLIPLLATHLACRNIPITLDIRGTLPQGSQYDFGKANYLGAFSSLDDIDFDEYDALVYTSWYDGLPNILLEAMAKGLPIVAPDIGGISDAVKSGATGYLVEVSGDDDETVRRYGDAIDHLYDDTDTLYRLAEAGREYVGRRHSHDAYYAGLKRIFNE